MTDIDIPEHCYECTFSIPDDDFLGCYYCLQMSIKKENKEVDNAIIIEADKEVDE